jgi:diguanylate cyclase (GGDEF)-like protein/PAS domain S-box-containing protein
VSEKPAAPTKPRRGRATDGPSLSTESWARRFVEFAPDLVCLCRGERIAYVNAAAKRFLGLRSAKSAVGRKLVKFVHPDHREIAADLMRGALADGASVTLKFVPREGRELAAEVSAVSVGNGSHASVIIHARDVSVQLKSVEAILERENRLRGIMDTVADGIITVNAKGKVLSFNPAAEEIFGFPAPEIVGENVATLLAVRERGGEVGAIKRYLGARRKKATATVRGIDRGRRNDGTEIALDVAINELGGARDRVITVVVRDISEQLSLEEELRRKRDELAGRVDERTRALSLEIAERHRAEEELRLAAAVIEATNEAVLITDHDFNVKSVNPAFTEITGYRPREVIGKAPPFLRALKSDRRAYKGMREALTDHGHWEGEIWNKRKSGEDYAERLAISAIAADERGARPYAVLIGDITKRKQDEEKIRRQANYDSLTGLPNRTLFLDRLNQSLAMMAREERKLGLMFIDLDGFKLVNDTLGHDIGDLLLQEAAIRLGACIRSGDTIARLGGDEFTVIMPDLLDARNAPMVAQRIIDSLAKPFLLEGQEAFVTGSIGITIYPDDGSDSMDLLRNADAAMYLAKDRGKNNYQFFTSDLNDEVRERMVLKNALIRARERDEFALFFQPKIDIPSDEIIGVEALMRWHSGSGTEVPPNRLVPILEEAGMIMEVGEWVIQTACRQYAAWRDAGLPAPRIAVNLSGRQLREPSFVSMVESVLADAGLGPDCLEIEVTEFMLMSESTNSDVALHALHDMGVRISLDDFGTGYSSLVYLKRFSIDTIKIDRSFISEITTSADDVEIVKAIITMGHSLNRRVTAEGVETAEQLAILREYGCDEFQGYLVCPPLPADKIAPIIARKKITYG